MGWPDRDAEWVCQYIYALSIDDKVGKGLMGDILLAVPGSSIVLAEMLFSRLDALLELALPSERISLC